MCLLDPRLASTMPYQFYGTRRNNISLLIIIFIFQYSVTNCSNTFQKENFERFLDLSNLLQQTSSKNVFEVLQHRHEKHSSSAKNAVHNFDNHEIVIPIRLHHETGHPVTHGRHFLRRRKVEEDHVKARRRRDLGLVEDKEHYLRDLALRNRRSKNNSHDVREGTFYDVIPNKYSGDSLDFIKEDNDQYLDHSVANYSLKAFGEQFLFHLAPYEDFLAPNYSLRYLADPAKDDPLHPDVPRHCFYAGYVNGKREHKAILSVCSGLFGAFRTDKSDYLIEPENMGSNPTHDTDADEEGTKPHRIHRRNVEQYSVEKKRCGYVDSENEHQDNKQANRNGQDDIERTGKMKKFIESYRRKLEETKRRQRRKMSKLRSHLRFSEEARSNSSLSGLILKKLGVTKLVNSRQVLEVLKLHDSLVFDENVREEKRRRRYLSYARNVEVMVTADNSMLRLHRDVEHYVLTLMAIVNHVYHDPSIENLINIVVVELVVIGDSQVRNGPAVVKDAHTCLKNFCDWQFRHNTPDDSHPSHHDTAVLITGKDICRSETACDTLGLAELGTICDTRRSCSINEDNGLSTAFTIAHEIGHEFNAPHDNSDKCRDSNGQLGSFNVMSPTLDNKAYPWSWSKCSAKYITSFLDNGEGRCLLDEPPQRVLSLPIEEPGEVFNANDQCSFVYGKGVTHCNFMFQNTCKRLWCVSQNITHGCRTPHVPWADGTRCGDRMWCQKGQCVPENRHRIPIDGSWGEWSPFGECSRTCGGGVKSAIRECNNPKPQYGGLFCTGRRKKYRPCNYQVDCPEGTDFRLEQCAQYNNVTSLKHRVQGVPHDATWIPKYDGIPEQDRCKLICQVRSATVYTSAWYILKPKVTNGTPCGPDTHNICVEGVCKPAGCDHVLNSNAKEDSCGICNGDNTGCRWVEGTYNRGYHIGYNQVTVIPRGATSVEITQRSFSGDANDNNYLALRDSRGSYILNGNRSVMRKKHRMRRRISGLSNEYAYYCDYSGTDHAIETINCSKAIGIDIVVEVLSAGDLMPPNIKYKYKYPVTHRWEATNEWSTCSAVCNGRIRKKMQCVRSDGQVASDRKCSYIVKPNYTVQSCNTGCRLEWLPESSQCSVRCGKGTKNTEYKCYKVENDFHDNLTSNSHARELVNNSMCPIPKPANGVAECRGDCLPARWQYEKWGECSATCGLGTQTRRGVCQDSKGTHFPPTECEEEAVLSRSCSLSVCPRWYTSSVGQCSASCGRGVQRQRVWCGARGTLRREGECDSSTKPSHTAPCNIRDCPEWKYGEWGECSVTCGNGVSRRSYQCVDGRRSIDRGSCDQSLLQNTKSCSSPRTCVDWSSSSSEGFPSLIQRGLAEQEPIQTTITEKTTTTTSLPIRPRLRSNYNIDTFSDVGVVNARHLVAHWRTGSWTPCSKSCDGGIRLRYVSCRHVLSGKEMNDAECGMEQRKPPSSEKCQTDPCPGIWRTGSWSKCSVSCGEGTRSRYVGCLFDGRYERNSVHCLADERPVERETCSTTTCTATTTTTTATTTNGFDVIDDVIRPTIAVPTVVDRISARKRNRVASIPDPGKWRTGPWSRCSNSCGSGTQKRVVVCRSSSGEPAFCSRRDRPLNQQACEGRECPSWRYDEWGKCSRSCGRGTRSRRVYCVNADGRPTYERKCDVTQRPDDVSSCNTKQCPAKHRWRKSDWSSCSTTCGRGTKTRQVQCVDNRGNVGDDALCATKRRGKPREVHRCVVQRKCPKWRTGKWGRCSASCGEGTMSRKVSCKYKRKAIVDKLCDVTKRPDDVKRCNVSKCSTYQWHAEEWNPCSRTCGEGVQNRRVSCRSLDDHHVIADVTCDINQDKPNTDRVCNAGPCSAPWVIGPWSECSRTCGPGIQKRDVRCTYIHPRNYTEINADSCDVSEKPYDVRDCDRGDCDARYYWRVGSWSQCSASCGEGHSVRRVVCSDRVSQSPQSDDVCQAIPSFRPDRTRKCRQIPCVPKTCLQLKNQQNINSDGEYFLKVNEKMAQIYCKGMNTSQPSEYLTLASGTEENYAEIFGFRLIDADTCPGNGSRDSNCACHRDHPDEGYTMFEKVRFDVSNMRVIVSDFAFAKTLFGKPVGFGTAGDCYSRNNCPQGVFRINLKGTSFSVSENTTWLSYGIDSTKHIYKSSQGDVVAGNCGGYCSRCQPDPLNGLLLKHNER